MILSLLDSIEPHRQALADLLIDSVHSGASVGFVPPLSHDESIEYWNGIMVDIRSGNRLLVVAFANGVLTGAVQLALCGKKNGLHRAEVEKLLVHTSYRRSGIGRALMEYVEQLARDNGRKLLVLDTRSDDVASTLYIRRDFVEAGRIPGYALSANGELEGTTYFYKSL
ncbi:GNAT family N-acetyltransferase [Dyella flava]|uniref:GNAT family N-acetyltransferase n=1 Tax=Dyella flava TaxID=1920170 RepID=A0ABS2K0S9_9GAMM|nr:GNAT family N-acetyltransferase [Dyella flava]MBM7124847.1 GNAT family N-acetyltransferase [Dyella flava]GLQ50890.1 N-acetyltransferase [Dyella flava]